MKKTMFTLLLGASFLTSAMPSLEQNNEIHGFQNDGTHKYGDRMMKPDMKLLTWGLQAYQKGSLQRAMKRFKRSAKLGNQMSKYLVALMYFEQQDFVSGYAWLQLLDEPIDHSAELLDKFATTLTDEEKSMAANQLLDLKRQYSNKLGKQRNKYVMALNANK